MRADPRVRDAYERAVRTPVIGFVTRAVLLGIEWRCEGAEPATWPPQRVATVPCQSGRERMMESGLPRKQGLYDPANEHDEHDQPRATAAPTAPAIDVAAPRKRASELAWQGHRRWRL